MVTSDHQRITPVDANKEHVLIRDEKIDQLWPDVVVVAVPDFDPFDSTSTASSVISHHFAWGPEVNGSVLVEQIPRWGKFELTGGHDNRLAVRFSGQTSGERSCEREQSSVGRNGVRADYDLRHARHEGIDRGVGDEEDGDVCGGEGSSHRVTEVGRGGFGDDYGEFPISICLFQEGLDGLRVANSEDDLAGISSYHKQWCAVVKGDTLVQDPESYRTYEEWICSRAPFATSSCVVSSSPTTSSMA